MKKLLSLLGLLSSLSLFSVEASVISSHSPWGTVIWPPAPGPKGAHALYSEVTDSIISCGVSWVRLTVTPPTPYLQEDNLEFHFPEADSYYAIIDSHNINALWMLYPNRYTNGKIDPPSEWTAFWDSVVGRYS